MKSAISPALFGVIVLWTTLAGAIDLIRAAPKRPWGPEQATGEPDTPVAGDQSTAWASATQDGADEWLELEYAEPIVAEAVLVYETYNPGALVRVIGFTAGGMDAELWAGKDPTPVGSGTGVSEIALKGKLETMRIRIYLNSKDVPGWNEIDAVGLRDAKSKVHWAIKAKASSTYGAGFAEVAAPFLPAIDIGFFPAPTRAGGGKKPWGAEQATGEPDTKMAGDFPTAWASATPDGADEWLELEYAEALKIETVKILESCCPGAVYKVTGYNDAGKEEVLWEGKDPTETTKDSGVSEIPVKGKLKTTKIRVYLKSKEVAGWNEIDAVAIKDAAGKQLWATKATASSDYGAAFGAIGVGEIVDFVLPAPAVRPAVVLPAGAGPAARDARIEKLEKEVADLKQALEEMRKQLEKPR